MARNYDLSGGDQLIRMTVRVGREQVDFHHGAYQWDFKNESEIVPMLVLSSVLSEQQRCDDGDPYKSLVPDKDTITVIQKRVVEGNDDYVYVCDIVMRKPQRGAVLTRAVDREAYRHGTSFMTPDGDIMVHMGKSKMLPIHPEYYRTGYFDGDEVMPLRVMWEPQEHMTPREVHDAEYGTDGLPYRVRLARDNNIDSSLAEGML